MSNSCAAMLIRTRPKSRTISISANARSTEASDTGVAGAKALVSA